MGMRVGEIFFFPVTPRGMWDLSSLTRDRTHAPCIGSAVLTTGSPWTSREICSQAATEWDYCLELPFQKVF